MRDDKSSAILAANIKIRLSSDEWDLAMAKRVLLARKTRTRNMMLAAAITLIITTTGLGIFTHTTGKQHQVTQSDFISHQVNGTYASVFPESSANTNGNAAPLSELDNLVDAALARR